MPRLGPSQRVATCAWCGEVLPVRPYSMRVGPGWYVQWMADAGWLCARLGSARSMPVEAGCARSWRAELRVGLLR